ncbi:MAG TPA: nuclear transport factor 2 family protein [Gemmatimonadales bacterium]|nr:nuclear transport factor 2 family protein [Gemmatimonadales bacterium]
MRWILVLSLLGAATGAAAQSAVDSVRALDSAWARAYATHDTTLALALFAPDLVVTSANGSLKSRADELGDIRPQPGLRMQYFRTSEVNIRIFGRSAVITGLATWRFTFNERDSEVSRRYTAVYAAGGPLGWRLVALHMGRAP